MPGHPGLQTLMVSLLKEKTLPSFEVLLLSDELKYIEYISTARYKLMSSGRIFGVLQLIMNRRLSFNLINLI